MDDRTTGTTAPAPSGRTGLVVVANRLPVSRRPGGDGRPSWRRSPGGLVSALDSYLKARGGTWVGWSGSSRGDEADVPESDGEVRLRPVPLSEEEHRAHYEGLSNTALWPLYHDAVVPPGHRAEWWPRYAQVNRRFAGAAADAAPPGADVWIHDYQLHLVPGMLRDLRPDLRIGFFLHIPFPPVDLLRRLPYWRELVRGLLGADLAGFQLAASARNFLAAVGEAAEGAVQEAAAGPLLGRVRSAGRETAVGAFPISVDTAGLEHLALRPEVRRRSREIRARLGDPHRVVLGVDRLDYTKGIDARIRALHGLLAEGRADPERVAMVQIATPSREGVEHYARTRAEIERAVGRVNGEFGALGRPVVHYRYTEVGREELAALFGAADVMLVTPYRDGMNLVCKEYVACRADGGGALVLSEFAGAAAELTDAYRVNPYDPDGMKTALARALEQSPEEGRRRMSRLRRQVAAHDVDHWARTFLAALEDAPGRPAPGADSPDPPERAARPAAAAR